MKFAEYDDVVAIYEEEFYGTLSDGLDRVLSRMESGEDFLIITAARGKYSRKKNSERNIALLVMFRKKIGLKIGAYKLVGHWKECSVPVSDNEKIKDCGGKIKNLIEESWLFFKPEAVSFGEFENAAKQLAAYFEQDAFVVRKDGDVFLGEKDGVVWDNLGKATKNSIQAGFSKIINYQGYNFRSRGRLTNIVLENIFVGEPKENNFSKILFESLKILF